MPELVLSSGERVLVDNEDFDFLNRWKWGLTDKGYVNRTIYKNGMWTKLYLHSLLLEPVDGFEVDHRNGDKLDNRKRNLRYATASQNHANSKVYKNSMFGLKGVGLHRGMIRAYIQVDGKAKHLGYFETIEEAALAYNAAAKAAFGEFARLNVVAGVWEDSNA